MLKVHPENLGESLETKHEKESEYLNPPDRMASQCSLNKKESNLSYMRSLNSSNFRNALGKQLDSRAFTVIITIFTIYALFGDDIRLAFFTYSEDTVFFSLASVSLGLFLLEFVLSLIGRKNYLWSYYFWLDLISIISMLPDIGWIWQLILGINSNTSTTKKIQNAAKASRIGARTSRVIRIVRLIRLVRIVKLCRQTKILTEEQLEDENIEELEYSTKDTRVGSKLSNLTTKRVISLVLIMLLILPLFDTGFYRNEVSWDTDLEVLTQFIDTDSYETVKDLFIVDQSSTKYPLIHFSYTDSEGNSEFTWTGDAEYLEMRYEEIYYLSNDFYVAIFDISIESKLVGVLDICQTIFVIIILTTGAFMFSKDSEDMIINPIKKMMQKVKNISLDPSILLFKKAKTELPLPKKYCCFSNKAPEQAQEIALIENTISSIGVLLILVFGEAGGKIIRDSMSVDGELVLSYQGVKTFAVFCFCDIRNFTDITEELQEDIILFVNEIAFIIHRYAYIYQGSANKNIGDAFLLVWKIKDGSNESSAVEIQTSADLSVICTLKIISNIKKDLEFQKYRENAKLRQRMPRFDIKVGFGIHMGWAIEGAIGSEYKIDPSYLSPNLNIAMTFEGLTKHFGVPLIFSEAVEQFLSRPLREHCRQIDCIKIPGKEIPIKIFTHDVNPNKLRVGMSKDKSRQVTDVKAKEVRKAAKNSNVAFDIIENSNSIQAMIGDFSQDFYLSFEKALDFYLEGHWVSAKNEFEEILKTYPDDGPSMTILNYMKKKLFIVPETWQGARGLNETT